MSIIEKAMEMAALAHRNQVRKGSNIPYIVHPCMVGMTLLKSGCDDEIVASGILHDTVEDTYIKIDDIKREFGDRVTMIVSGCSESDKSQSWEERKSHTIEFLKNAHEEVKIVSCADKLSNITSIYNGYREIGEEVFDKFKRGRKKQEWYYRGIVDAICTIKHEENVQWIFDEYKKMVDKVFG